MEGLPYIGFNINIRSIFANILDFSNKAEPVFIRKTNVTIKKIVIINGFVVRDFSTNYTIFTNICIIL